MVHPCGPCGCPLEQGVKIFSIVDMVLACLGLFIPALALIGLGFTNLPLDFTIFVLFWFLIYFARAVSSFLLFFMGVTKRNVMMCWVWIGVAVGFFAINFIIACIMWFKHKQIGSGITGTLFWVYLVYGAWLVYEFIRWIKSGARAETVVPTVVLAPSVHSSQRPPAYSQHPSKTGTQAGNA